MGVDFGPMLREYRRQKGFTLRDFAGQAGMDPGNFRKVERGRLDPPQDPDILDRLCWALGYTSDGPRSQGLRDRAAVQTGRIPHDMLADDSLIADLPALLRVAYERHRSGAAIEDLIEMLRRGWPT